MAEQSQTAQKDRVEQARAESTRSGPHFVPRVDIYENDSELTLYADIPGVAPEEVDLRYEQGELILHATLTPRDRPGQLMVAEYEEGDFYRVFQVHESIDASQIDAECKNGVLTVHLPKEKSAQPRKVNVKG